MVIAPQRAKLDDVDRLTFPLELDARLVPQLITLRLRDCCLARP
jgi:hypothetical protein